MPISDASMSFGAFVRSVLDAIEAANVPYLIGGAVALAAWGENRTTRDLDLVVDLPFESMGDLSRELEKRDMLVPIDIMIDLALEDRADLPINAIHMFSAYKAELFLLKPGDAFRETCLQRRQQVDLGPPLGEESKPRISSRQQRNQAPSLARNIFPQPRQCPLPRQRCRLGVVAGAGVVEEGVLRALVDGEVVGDARRRHCLDHGLHP